MPIPDQVFGFNSSGSTIAQIKYPKRPRMIFVSFQSAAGLLHWNGYLSCLRPGPIRAESVESIGRQRVMISHDLY